MTGAAALSACVEPLDEAAVEQPVISTYECAAPGTGFGAFALAPGVGGLPFVPLTSLAAVPNPVIPRNARGNPIIRDDLTPYVANLSSAIQLGKALFWDVQLSSDDAVACATCHFHAGADPRDRHQLHPGANGSFDGLGTNHTLAAGDFPFTNALLGLNVDNAAGSQGLRSSVFVGISGAGVEQTQPATDPVFGTTRQVTALNSPTVINSVFNHRNFFNGRAQPEFNGVSPWGDRDGTARVWRTIDNAGNLGQIDLHILTASLASQAVGPPVNTTEMSAQGRTFADLGQKMLLVKPLRLQKVHSKDSVLGPVAEGRQKGLKTTYATLIQRAFQPQWWSSNKTVTLGGKTYSLMAANFSMFVGISIMLYEATLVSDQSPMDQYAGSRTFDAAGNLTGHNPALLDAVVTRLAAQGITAPLAGGGSRAITRADILLGLDLFEKPIPLPSTSGIPAGMGVGCALCHLGAETTSASIRNLQDGLEPGATAFKDAGFDLRMERMFMGVRTPAPTPPQPPPPVPLGTDAFTFDSSTYAVTVTSVAGAAVPPQTVPTATYDVGWYNVGVRPPEEDLGIGAQDAFSLPLSWTKYYQTVLTNPSLKQVPGGGIGCVTADGIPVTPPSAPVTSPFAGEVVGPNGKPILAGGLVAGEATDVDGSFKTSTLRNLELTGPYLHTGGKSTLRQVVEFYDDGGDAASASLSPLLRPLGMTEDQIIGMVAFLLSMTDDRVLYQRGPFDHPELPVPAGEGAGGADLITVIPEVGNAGQATPLPRFLGLNPFEP